MEITVHSRTPGETFDSTRGRVSFTHVVPGVYRLKDHYFKRDGLEVAVLEVPGIENFVSVCRESGNHDPRTWDVSSDTYTIDYRRSGR